MAGSAADRRRRRADLAKRRCPACRSRRLSDLGEPLVWCEACGETGPAEYFPYLGCYTPKEST